MSRTDEDLIVDNLEARRAGYLGVPYCAPSPEVRDVYLMACGRRAEFVHWLAPVGMNLFQRKLPALGNEYPGKSEAELFDLWLCAAAIESFHQYRGVVIEDDIQEYIRFLKRSLRTMPNVA